MDRLKVYITSFSWSPVPTSSQLVGPFDSPGRVCPHCLCTAAVAVIGVQGNLALRGSPVCQSAHIPAHAFWLLGNSGTFCFRTCASFLCFLRLRCSPVCFSHVWPPFHSLSRIAAAGWQADARQRAEQAHRACYPGNYPRLSLKSPEGDAWDCVPWCV